jgi:hypothetical protein
MTSRMPAPGLHIALGMCDVLLAYDIRSVIDLVTYGQLLATLLEHATI